MNQVFHKYQGTGNDFIVIDNRENHFPKDDTKLIKRLCHRKFGIGSDGLILLEKDKQYDFKMSYYNANGHEGSMCGNGGRCIVSFAQRLGIVEKEKVSINFLAIDGPHHANIAPHGVISLKMSDVHKIDTHDHHIFIDTGSPHHIEIVEDLDTFDVYNIGKHTAHNKPYFEKGTNVNFVHQIDTDTFQIRTYERGVENETLACGTGATAVAIAMHHLKKTSSNIIMIKTKGGDLKIHFTPLNETYQNIYLEGPTAFVFEGLITL